MKNLIDKLNHELVVPVNQMVYIGSLSKLGKAERVKKLVELRRQYFDIDKDARSKDENIAKEKAFDMKYSPIALNGELGEPVASKMYYLSDDVMK